MAGTGLYHIRRKPYSSGTSLGKVSVAVASASIKHVYANSETFATQTIPESFLDTPPDTAGHTLVCGFVLRAAIRTALGIGLLASVAVGVLGTSNSGAGVKQIFVKACGGDKALQADPPAFSRCMRPLPPWAD